MLSGNMQRQARADTVRLVGGELCLDFANSIDWEDDGRPRPSSTDALSDEASLVAWGRRLGLLSREAEVEVTRGELEAVSALRDTVHAIFAAIARSEAPHSGALEALTADYRDAVANGRLASEAGAWGLHWPPDQVSSIRYAAAASAVALLGDAARLARVRQCPGQRCGWLFLDTSGRRRWCSMEVCGSRAKMRRFYRRRQGTGGGG